MLGTILIILLVLFLLGAVGSAPQWGHSREWGYGPSGGLLTLVIVILLILILTGNLRL